MLKRLLIPNSPSAGLGSQSCGRLLKIHSFRVFIAAKLTPRPKPRLARPGLLEIQKTHFLSTMKSKILYLSASSSCSSSPLFNFNWKKNAKNSLNISSGFLGNRPQRIRKKRKQSPNEKKRRAETVVRTECKIFNRCESDGREKEEERGQRLYRIQRSVAILPQVRHRLFYAVPFCSDGLY